MMRLDKTPPKGAGKPQGVTKTERLLQIIEGLGQDKQTFLPVDIRTTELAKRADVNPNSIGVLLAPHILSGRIRCCKITVPGTPPQNEYRAGAGVAMPDFKPLKTKRGPGSLVARPGATPVAAVPLSTPKPAVGEIVTPTFISKTQPEVVAPTFVQTPAAGGVPNPPAAEPAVAATATPKPKAGAALKEEPATPRTSAGDVTETDVDELLLSIDQDGALQVGYGDDPARWIFTQRHVLALGDFLDATQGLWRP